MGGCKGAQVWDQSGHLLNRGQCADAASKTSPRSFDACPTYVLLPYAAERMARLTPGAKIIIMMRQGHATPCAAAAAAGPCSKPKAGPTELPQGSGGRGLLRREHDQVREAGGMQVVRAGLGPGLRHGVWARPDL